MSDDFPFVINGIAEEDTVTSFFASMADFDSKTLLRCRAVSRKWRDAIDRSTLLWSRMSLQRAVDQHRLDICQLIVSHAINKNPAEGEDGQTPLHVAARLGHFDIYVLIAVAADDSNPTDVNRNTPLHEAAKEGHLDICHWIVGTLDDPNPTDEDGNTPLHWAAKGGHLEVYTFIMDRVDDINPPNYLWSNYNDIVAIW